MADMQQLLFIGCGNMGGAMLAGWLAAGEAPGRFAILDPGLPEAPEGVTLYRSADEVPSDHDAVLLGFKPQQLGALAPGLQGVTRGKALHSLLAGLTLEKLGEAFPDAASHMRVMPNLAARINKSPVILAQSGMEEGGKAQVLSFYDQLGSASWLEEEDKFDLVTALAGSGPGFVYRFIDALAGAGAALGLDPAQSGQLAKVMVEGAASLASAETLSPGELADRVASPGGMTREGLNVLDADKALLRLLTETLDATAKRGGELSRGSL